MNIVGEKNWVQQNFGSKTSESKNLGSKIGLIKVRLKKFLVQINRKLLAQKFEVQNYLDQKKFGKKIWSINKSRPPTKLGPKSLVKIGSVIAEIVLI